MQKIKIVEFVTRLEFGGVESMLLNYTSHFKNPEQFDLHIITQDINDANCIRQFENSGYSVHVVTHKRKSILKNVREIYRIMHKEKFDVAHSHMTLTNFYVLFIAKILRVPLRVSHSHNAFKDTGIKAKIVYPVLKYLNKLSANIWMACGYDAATFLYGEKAVRSEKVFIAHNAIDINKFRRNNELRKKIRKQYGIEDVFCVGHIGRFMLQKNHMFLIEIFSELQKIKSDSILFVIGDGELREEIYREVEKYHLENSVIFTGNITNVNELYQAMDFFVLPSLYEGLPVVSIEAQAAGLRCLISDSVDVQCAITSYVNFLSVEKTAKEWAISILKYFGEEKEDDNIDVLVSSGYDINVEARKMEMLYKMGVFE